MLIPLLRRWEMYMRHEPVSLSLLHSTLLADLEQEPVSLSPSIYHMV